MLCAPIIYWLSFLVMSYQVLSGQIDAEILVGLSAEELASDDRRQENDKIRDYKKAECERGLKNVASTDMVRLS